MELALTGGMLKTIFPKSFPVWREERHAEEEGRTLKESRHCVPAASTRHNAYYLERQQHYFRFLFKVVEQ